MSGAVDHENGLYQQHRGTLHWDGGQRDQGGMEVVGYRPPESMFHQD